MTTEKLLAACRAAMPGEWQPMLGMPTGGVEMRASGQLFAIVPHIAGFMVGDMSDLHSNHASLDDAIAEIARRKAALVTTLQDELAEYAVAQARRVAPTLEWAATRVGATTARGHHTLTRYEDGEWSASIGGWTGRGPTPDAAWAEAVRKKTESEGGETEEWRFTLRVAFSDTAPFHTTTLGALLRDKSFVLSVTPAQVELPEMPTRRKGAKDAQSELDLGEGAPQA
jgi:hypothetical protein